MDQSPYTVTVRLPSRTEYWYTETLPLPGSIMSYRGRTYFVDSCEQMNGSGWVLRLTEPELDSPGGVEPLPA